MFPCPSTGLAIDAYAQDALVHLGGVREPDGLANHTWDPRPSGQMRARDGLRVACASPLSCGSQRPSVAAQYAQKATRAWHRQRQQGAWSPPATLAGPWRDAVLGLIP